MIDTSTLYPGDKVRIVSKWCDGCGANPSGLMDKYLGTIMTVDYANKYRACMVEDGGRWSWNGMTIVEIIDDNIEPATQEELIALLMG